jgi:hypothetical protein
MRYFSLTMLNIDIKFFEGAESCLLEFVVDHLPPMSAASSSSVTSQASW